MQNLCNWLLVSIFSVFLISCEADDSQKVSEENQKQIDSAIATIKAESRVEDFYYEDLRDGAQWNVGVIPSQGSEYGYANFMCDVLREHGLDSKEKIQIVRIVDITKVFREQVSPKTASLSRIRCDTYKVFPE